MPRSTGPFPPDHEVAIARVIRVVDIIGAAPTIEDDAVVSHLVGEGVPEVDAELLVRFVPCAMSFGYLKLLGVSNFPSSYLLRNGAGKWVTRPLSTEHYFTSALQLGFDLVNIGFTDRIGPEEFNVVIQRSAEIDAVSQLIEKGGAEAVVGATLGPPALIGITAEQVDASRLGHSASRTWWRFWG